MANTTGSSGLGALLIVVSPVLSSCAPSDDAVSEGIDATELARRWPTTRCQPVPPNGVDLDKDGILDACEFDVAKAFRPSLVFHPEEEAPDRETYWAVGPIKNSSSLRVLYALGYHRDAGSMTGHEGDSEAIILSVTPQAGRWTATSVSMSAHWDYSSPAFDSLKWVGDRVGERLVVWVSRDKHANFESLSECDRSISDTCEDAPPSSVEVLRGANLGHYTRPYGRTLRDCGFGPDLAISSNCR